MSTESRLEYLERMLYLNKISAVDSRDETSLENRRDTMKELSEEIEAIKIWETPLLIRTSNIIKEI